MKRVISFSLYGTSPKYLEGAVRNAELASKFYPGWDVWFYTCYGTVPLSCRNHLLEKEGCRAIPMRGNLDIPPMFWRFLVADYPDVERFIVRDADSRLNAREAEACKEWIAEDTVGWICRDHPAHQVMPGGLWGAMWRRSNWEAPRMETLIREFMQEYPTPPDLYNYDQLFLRKKIWPWLKGSATVHDSCPERRVILGGRRFPTRRVWPEHVGAVFDENDQGRDFDNQQVPKDDGE